MRARSTIQAVSLLGCALFAARMAAADTAKESKRTSVVAPSVEVDAPRLLRGTAIASSTSSALALRTSLVEACQADARDRGEPIEGRIALRLFLSRMDPKVPAGFVDGVVVSASDELSSTLRACVASAYRHAIVGALDAAPSEVALAISLDRGSTDSNVKPAASSCGLDVDGEMTDALRAEVKQRAQNAALCFQRPAGAGEPSTLSSGSMKVHVRIAGDGTVCGATLDGDDFARASLSECVLQTISSDYAAHPSGAMDVTIPLVFKPAA